MSDANTALPSSGSWSRRAGTVQWHHGGVPSVGCAAQNQDARIDDMTMRITSAEGDLGLRRVAASPNTWCKRGQIP
jgi:hypothetical protein